MGRLSLNATAWFSFLSHLRPFSTYIADTVTIHYIGTLIDGKKFDSSRDRDDPFVTKIGVGQVIKGWDEGTPYIAHPAARRIQAVLRHLQAYGARGFPPVIPPNSTLRFEVELLKIN
ncbi:hypothetical protein EDB89DRAFT_1842420 [Lactarius sanguifluus]|nr:hypothetical protein EDB89DRAFT_1842420 [Lactarius sanguifluus]